MDEKQKILQQLPELSRAQAALMGLQPPGVREFQRLATRISDLQFRLFALAGQPVLRQLTAQEVATLQGAVQTLQTAVMVSAGATQIMAAATTLLNS
jgi:aspartate/methionine/tyrosine aminotransferase